MDNEVVPKPNNNRDNKPKFEKPLWVSRMDPATSNDDVVAYITSNTSVTDKEQISVHKFVKKDVDLSTLKFISFKVEMNADDLKLLNDENLWPEKVQVREFMQTPKNVLGNYFPPLNEQAYRAAAPAANSNEQVKQTASESNADANLLDLQ